MQNPPGNGRSLTQEFNPVKPLGTPRATHPCFSTSKKHARSLAGLRPCPGDTLILGTQFHRPTHPLPRIRVSVVQGAALQVPEFEARQYSLQAQSLHWVSFPLVPVLGIDLLHHDFMGLNIYTL